MSIDRDDFSLFLREDGLGWQLEFRAELVLSLIRMSRFEDAVEGAIPLAGTPFQPCFLYARAWYEWSLGESKRALSLLKTSLELLERSDQGPLEFLIVDGTPVLTLGFSRFSVGHRRKTSYTLTARDVNSLKGVVRLLAFLHPRFGDCAISGEPRNGVCLPDEADPWLSLFGRCLSNPQCRLEMVEQLLVLWTQYPHSTGVTACTVFFLLLVDRSNQAVKICQSFIARRPYVSLIRALNIVCLYRTGQRTAALSQGEQLLARRRRDCEGWGPLFLGLLALEEGSIEVAYRFLRESALRGNRYATDLEETFRMTFG